MLLKGRKKLISEYKQADAIDKQVVINIINATLPTHLSNKTDIDYLMSYKSGNQPVLLRCKDVRPEINNKIVINHAQMITRNIIGYFLGNPIQYIQSGGDKQAQIDMLNQFVAYQDKGSSDIEIGEYQSICGTAYRIIYTDGVYGDEVPFEEKALNPSTTFVVYENSVSEKPILGVTYYDILNEDGAKSGTKLYAYTAFGLYTFSTEDGSATSLASDTPAKFEQYSVGGVPIIEYPNNVWRLGDWELCLGLMDAINGFYSGRLDDVDQIVQSLMVFINADIDADKYQEMRDNGVIVLKNNTNSQSSVTNIENYLDQAGMHMFAEELEGLLYALIGIPDRNQRAGGGGDTGQAVELRDGWADLEVIARNKELVFKKAEKQSLRIMLNIINNSLDTKLSLLDIDVKFTRNKNNNLLVKVQSYSTLLLTKTLSPADCLTIVDLVSDVNEYVNRGKVFWGDQFAGLQQTTTIQPPNDNQNNNQNNATN